MSNKIESYGPQAPAAPLRTRATAPSAVSGTGSPVGAVVPADSVRLTGDAVMLAELGEQLAAAPAVDGQRVAEARLALAEGRYEINEQRIADKLLRFEWGLSRP
jgi:negative regulator of flagellin synthesis FlgM